jgi:glycosyltransferase involved in cell wall biosynthesis
VDGEPHRVTAARMPRRDLFQALHPGLTGERRVSARVDPGSSEDPEVRCYRSGFWATIRIQPRDRPGRIELSIKTRLDDGTVASAPLGSIDVSEPSKPPSYEGLRGGGDRGPIAICMATFEPDIELFRAQVDSIRAQTDTDWICLISDDCSRPDRFEAVEETVAEDPRFVVSRSGARLGFYRNFERALEMAPAEARLVALCDHDDRWYPEKLETLRGALGSAQLVYSDQRLVDHDGRVLADTFWEGRRNNYRNLPSLLIANTITGAATLFRREVLDFALPFPDIPAWQFHDHWLGLVALATGDVAYVNRPLYDYVQHEGAILGQVAVGPDASSDPAGGRGRRPSLRGLRQFFSGWRAAYFCAYVRLEVQAQVLLARCSDELTARKRRALERFVASGRSPFALAWLGARPLRALLGRNETLGAEAQLARGILWRHIITARAWRRERPRGSGYDASLPPCGPDSFGQKRLRRWRGQARTPRQRTPTG